MLKPTARTVFNAYFSFDASKINYMRPEACAYALTMCNVRAGSVVAIVGDASSAALCGAVLERLGSDERLLLLHGTRRAPSLTALRHWPPTFARRVDFAAIGSDAASSWAATRGGVDCLLCAGRIDPRQVFLR